MEKTKRLCGGMTTDLIIICCFSFFSTMQWTDRFSLSCQCLTHPRQDKCPAQYPMATPANSGGTMRAISVGSVGDRTSADHEQLNTDWSSSMPMSKQCHASARRRIAGTVAYSEGYRSVREPALVSSGHRQGLVAAEVGWTCWSHGAERSVFSAGAAHRCDLHLIRER